MFFKDQCLISTKLDTGDAVVIKIKGISSLCGAYVSMWRQIGNYFKTKQKLPSWGRGKVNRHNNCYGRKQIRDEF